MKVIVTATKWLIVAVFFVAINFPSWAGWLEQPALDYIGDIQVESPVYAGQVVKTHSVRCNYSNENIVYTIIRTLVNVETGERTAFSSTVTEAPPGCITTENRMIIMPIDIHSGKYQLIGVSLVSGKFRQFQVHWQTTIFEVINSNG